MKPTYEELAVQLANAESKCRALAAENSSKSRCLGFFVSVIKSGEKWTSVCEHEYSKALKNQATDAFLAEARRRVWRCSQKNSEVVLRFPIWSKRLRLILRRSFAKE